MSRNHRSPVFLKSTRYLPLRHFTYFTPRVVLRPSLYSYPTCMAVALAARMNFTNGANASELLSLDVIRNQLIRLEDTIIFREF